jgi:hypothetical protein
MLQAKKKNQFLFKIDFHQVFNKLETLATKYQNPFCQPNNWTRMGNK